MNETWETTTWAGLANYECRLCPYKTLDARAMHRHARMHRARGETVRPEATAAPEPAREAGDADLAGLDFASDEAAEAAAALPPEAIAYLAAQQPSGVGGYTMADVRRAARAAVTSEPKEG